MALPRTKVEIQNSWLQWLNDRAAMDGLTAPQRAALKSQLAAEVEWMIRVPDLEQNLQLRLNKITALLAENDGSLAAFDVWWEQRQAFLQWMQT